MEHEDEELTGVRKKRRNGKIQRGNECCSTEEKKLRGSGRSSSFLAVLDDQKRDK